PFNASRMRIGHAPAQVIRPGSKKTCTSFPPVGHYKIEEAHDASTPVMATGPIGKVLQHLRHRAGAEGTAALSDRQLLERFLVQQEEAAFAALVQRHGPLVLGVCRRVLHNEHDAEDVFQATFLVLVRKAEAIRKQESVGSWLHGVAYRIALKAR